MLVLMAALKQSPSQVQSSAMQCAGLTAFPAQHECSAPERNAAGANDDPRRPTTDAMLHTGTKSRASHADHVKRVEEGALKGS